MINVTRDSSDPRKPKTTITVDNGDLAALDDVIEKWKLKDEAGVIRFAVAVMREAKDKLIIVNGESGPVRFAPADRLVKTDSASEVDDGHQPEHSES